MPVPCGGHAKSKEREKQEKFQDPARQISGLSRAKTKVKIKFRNYSHQSQGPLSFILILEGASWMLEQKNLNKA